MLGNVFVIKSQNGLVVVAFLFARFLTAIQNKVISTDSKANRDRNLNRLSTWGSQSQFATLCDTVNSRITSKRNCHNRIGAKNVRGTEIICQSFVVNRSHTIFCGIGKRIVDRITDTNDSLICSLRSTLVDEVERGGSGAWWGR